MSIHLFGPTLAWLYHWQECGSTCTVSILLTKYYDKEEVIWWPGPVRCTWQIKILTFQLFFWTTIYCRRRKIHWAKHLQFQPHALRFSQEILSHCLGQQCLLFSIIKERHLVFTENFHSSPKNHKSLVHQIFPCLW